MKFLQRMGEKLRIGREEKSMVRCDKKLTVGICVLCVRAGVTSTKKTLRPTQINSQDMDTQFRRLKGHK